MTDVFSREKRSQVMACIKSKDTKPETVVRKFLFSNGFRFRVHGQKLPGKPDIVLKKYRTVILVHGCYWHGHLNGACKTGGSPKSNLDYWRPKIFANQNRDAKNIELLKGLGWQVVVIWECELLKKNMENTLQTLIIQLRSCSP